MAHNRRSIDPHSGRHRGVNGTVASEYTPTASRRRRRTSSEEKPARREGWTRVTLLTAFGSFAAAVAIFAPPDAVTPALMALLQLARY